MALEQTGVQYFSSTFLPVGFEKKRMATTDVTKNEVSPKKMAQMKTGGTQKNEVMSAKKPQIYFKMPSVNICWLHQQVRARKQQAEVCNRESDGSSEEHEGKNGNCREDHGKSKHGNGKGFSLVDVGDDRLDVGLGLKNSKTQGQSPSINFLSGAHLTNKSRLPT